MLNSQDTTIGTFALAKQCGVEIAFRFADQDLPPTDCLLLPCLSGPAPLRRHEWHRILQRVQAGATLYLSLNDGVVPEFTEHTGLRVLRRSARAQPASLRFTNAPEHAIPMTTGDRLECSAVDGTVHATDETGAPALVETPHGKGRIISLTFPLERQLALTPGALEPDNTPAARRIYRMLRPNPRAFACDNPAIGVTEHRLSDTRALIVAVNYTPKPTSTVVRIATGTASPARGEVPILTKATASTCPDTTPWSSCSSESERGNRCRCGWHKRSLGYFRALLLPGADEIRGADDLVSVPRIVKAITRSHTNWITASKDSCKVCAQIWPFRITSSVIMRTITIWRSPFLNGPRPPELA